MSRHISVESIQGKQRKDIVQEIQQRAKKEVLQVVKEQREKCKLLLSEASAIYQAPTAGEARTRLQTWVQHWQGCAPDAVATLQRDFEATVVFYQLDGITRQWIRTTSLLERANRAFRTKFRQAVTFGSQIGAEVALYLQVLRLHASWTDGSWWDISQDLPFALRELHP